jgi:hypothetical protein
MDNTNGKENTQMDDSPQDLPPYQGYDSAPAIKPEFWTALAVAQGRFEPIHKSRTVTVATRTGGSYVFAYAPLETILKATLPALNANGFALTQAIIEDRTEDTARHYLETRLHHAAGSLSNRVQIILGADMTPQAYGSANTYARRMGVTQLLCVAADDDEDGNEASGNTVKTLVDKPARAPAAPRPNAEIAETAIDMERLEGLVTDAVEDLLEAAHEGRAVGITQIWDEIKAKEYVAKRVWEELQRRSPDLFAIIKGILRPIDTTARGPKPAADSMAAAKNAIARNSAPRR